MYALYFFPLSLRDILLKNSIKVMNTIIAMHRLYN